VVIGVARVSIPGNKTIFASPPTKTAGFEIYAKARKRQKVLHLLFVTSVYFSK